jgi:hypothetical protein
MGESLIFITEETISLNPRNNLDPFLGHPPEQAQWPEFTFMGLKMSDDNDNLAQVGVISIALPLPRHEMSATY